MYFVYTLMFLKAAAAIEYYGSCFLLGEVRRYCLGKSFVPIIRFTKSPVIICMNRLDAVACTKYSAF